MLWTLKSALWCFKSFHFENKQKNTWTFYEFLMPMILSLTLTNFQCPNSIKRSYTFLSKENCMEWDPRLMQYLLYIFCACSVVLNRNIRNVVKKFILISYSLYRCCCGQARQTHPTIPGIEHGSPGDLWLPNKHTRPHATDAYGTIEFQGGAHPTKAQVIHWWFNKYIHFNIIISE